MAQYCYDLERLPNSSTMYVTEYTHGLDIYDIKPAFFALLSALNMKLVARKDDYGNLSYEVIKDE